MFETFSLISILNMNITFSITYNGKYKPVLSAFSTGTQCSNEDVLLNIFELYLSAPSVAVKPHIQFYLSI